MKNLKKTIEYAFEQQNNKIVQNTTKDNIDVFNIIKEVIKKLDNGDLFVSEKINNQWITHEWLKKAILLLFRNTNSKIINYGEEKFFDKCSSKFSNWRYKDFRKKNLRVVPPANVRYGAYIGSNTVIMPSFINIGAYINTGTMIDTWSTIGSCAYIGKNVHISGGVGIGGVLEPLQNNPTIIEDNCFIGSRSEIVEGVIVEEGSVISMGVFIGKSTKIYDRNTEKIHYGRVPAGSVVIPGSLPSSKKNNKINTYCAVIVKTVDSKTRSKTKLNELLRT